MKKKLFVAGSLFVFFFHSLNNQGLTSLALFLVAVLALLGVYDSVIQMFQLQTETVHVRIRKSHKMFEVLKSLSDLPDDEFEKALENPLQFQLPETSKNKAESNENISSVLNKIETQKAVDSLEMIESPIKNDQGKKSNIIQYPNKKLSSVELIKESISKLPLKDKKLVLLVSHNTELDESNLLRHLKKGLPPVQFIKKSIYLRTDALEVSFDCYSKNKNEFLKLNVHFGSDYQHFIILVPQTESPHLNA